MNDKFRSDNDIKEYLDNTAQGELADSNFDEIKESEGDGKNVLCILTSLLLIIGGIILNFFFDSPYFILRIILAITAGVSLFFSGYYVIIIPLIIVNVYKWGRAPRKYATAVSVLCLIASILCILLYFLSTAW